MDNNIDVYFDKIKANIQNAVVSGMRNAAEMVENEAKALLPEGYEELRASITSSVTQDDEGVKGVVGTSAPYAPSVEFGSIDRPPAPFLYPALNNNKENIKQAFKDAIRKAVQDD